MGRLAQTLGVSSQRWHTPDVLNYLAVKNDGETLEELKMNAKVLTAAALALLVPASHLLAQDATDWVAVNEGLLKKAPSALRELPLDEFCICYGNALRNQTLANGYDGPEAPGLVRQEAKRRKLRIVDTEAISEKIKIGITQCQMLASWGEPRDKNRSVGSWGVHIQYIYSGAYVYIKNGVVTGFQD